MRVVVVGGVGFLGANVTPLLRERGYEVVVAAKRGAENEMPLIASHLRRLGAQLALFPRIEERGLGELAGDVYLYLIGLIGVFTGRLEDFREAQVSLLEETVKAAAPIGARVVYVSSIAAIGGIKGVKPGSTIYEEEEHLGGERVYSNYYEITKAEGERALVKMGRELKGRWSILRPGIFIGPWGRHADWRFLRRSLSFRIAPYFGVGLPIVDVRDVAEVLVEAGEGKYEGQWVHVVSPYYPEVADLIVEGCRYEGKRCLPVPAQPLGSLGLLLSPLAVRLAPKGSSLSLVLNWLRYRYRYASRFLRREWRDVREMVRGTFEWQDSAAQASAAAGI
ncbi:MAG: NAD-dependent epimerase/dehydratase family protein [Acidilobaceae archaeon]